MPTLNHIHTYKRANHPKRRDIFVCTDPRCSFRSTKVYLEDKIGLCPFCEKEYVLTGKMLAKLKLPHCEFCTDRKASETELKAEPKVEIAEIAAAQDFPVLGPIESQEEMNSLEALLKERL